MAIEYDRRHETQGTYTTGSVEYDEATGLVTIVRTYETDDADPETAAANLVSSTTPVPYTFDIHIDDARTALGWNLETIPASVVASASGSWTGEVDMYLVHWRIVRVAEGRSQILATYEGHKIGVISANLPVQGESAGLVWSLDNPPQPFGPSTTHLTPPGITRLVPCSKMVIVENAKAVDVEEENGKWDKAQILVGSVNENGWFVDFFPHRSVVITCTEGQYLMTGADMQHNRDETYTIQWTFEKQYNRLGSTDYAMHKYPWVHQKPVADTTVTPKRLVAQVLGDVKTPKRYPIAGTDFATTFNSLGL